MSNTGTSNSDEPKMTSINLRLSEAFLDDIDVAWKDEGFSSRSEFMRYVLRDAVRHLGLSRETWKSIASTEHELRMDETEVVPSEEIRAGLMSKTDESDDEE